MYRRRYRKNISIEQKKAAHGRSWGILEEEDEEIVATWGGDPELDSADVVKIAKICIGKLPPYRFSRGREDDAEFFYAAWKACLLNPSLTKEDFHTVALLPTNFVPQIVEAYLSLLDQWWFVHSLTSGEVKSTVVNRILTSYCVLLGNQKYISLPSPGLPHVERIAMYQGATKAIEDRLEQTGQSLGWSYIEVHPLIVEMCLLQISKHNYMTLFRKGYENRIGLSKGDWR